MAKEAILDAIVGMFRKRSALRRKAREYQARYGMDKPPSVRCWNTLRECAKLTVAIAALREML